VTTINKFNESAFTRTSDEIYPDIAARWHFIEHEVSVSLIEIFITLNSKNSTCNSTLGYGLTTGGKFKRVPEVMISE